MYWTTDFQRDYRSYTGARVRAVSVVREAVRRRENLKNWYHGKRSMQGVAELVYELKVTHSDRLLVRTKGDALCLVAMGDHGVTSRYAARSESKRAADFATASTAPLEFDPAHEAPLFLEIDAAAEPQWAEELGQDWLHFLGEPQMALKTDLTVQIFLSILKPAMAPYVGLVAGGAGTGKTALLLNIALDMVGAGLKVDFRCSPEMRKYLQAHTRINMAMLEASVGMTPHVVFLDDPQSVWTVPQAVNDARSAGVRAVIAGFDPLQWWNDKRLSTGLNSLQSLGEIHKLTTCYRQSSNLVTTVQQVSRTVNEKSSWRAETTAVQTERAFLDSLLTEYSDGLETIKPGGRVARHQEALDAAVEAEAQRLRQGTSWDDLPVLLVLLDEARGVTLRPAWKESLRGIRRVSCDIADVNRYRGLDFQSVWLFLSAELLRQLEHGRVGLSAAQWSELRRLHIALTRAKDETVLFSV